MVAAGCQTAHVAQPLTATLGGSDPGQQIEFWHQLAEQPVASNDDAFHGLLLYLDGDDKSADYAARVAALNSKNLLPAGFSGAANDGIQRGTLAVVMVKALHIKGGWAMHAFGANPRYATRELQFLGLYPLSSPGQTFTGSEFLGIMGKFEDEQRARTPQVAASDQGRAEAQTATQQAESPSSKN